MISAAKYTAGPDREYVARFAWGYRNYVGGSDDWRCDVVNSRETDKYGEPLYDYDPCECPECDGATAREWDHGKPTLSTRVKLNLADRAVIAKTEGGAA